MHSFQRAPAHASAAAELLLMRSANRNLRKMLHVSIVGSGDVQLVVQGLHSRSHVASQLLQHTICLQLTLKRCETWLSMMLVYEFRF